MSEGDDAWAASADGAACCSATHSPSAHPPLHGRESDSAACRTRKTGASRRQEAFRSGRLPSSERTRGEKGGQPARPTHRCPLQACRSCVPQAPPCRGVRQHVAWHPATARIETECGHPGGGMATKPTRPHPRALQGPPMVQSPQALPGLPPLPGACQGFPVGPAMSTGAHGMLSPCHTLRVPNPTPRTVHEAVQAAKQRMAMEARQNLARALAQRASAGGAAPWVAPGVTVSSLHGGLPAVPAAVLGGGGGGVGGVMGAGHGGGWGGTDGRLPQVGPRLS